LNWSFKNVLLPEGCDYLMMLDFDMFLMSEFSIEEFMANHSFAGVPQSNGSITYYWSGMLMMKMSGMPNKQSIDFGCGDIAGCGRVDSGGFIYLYLRDNPGVAVRAITHTCHISSQQHFSYFFVDDIANKYGPDFGFEVYTDQFLHYGRGSNWNNSPQDFVGKKTALLNEIFRRQASGEKIFKR
jgi:hypothetical protein